jgi:hypothetical protein
MLNDKCHINVSSVTILDKTHNKQLHYEKTFHITLHTRINKYLQYTTVGEPKMMRKVFEVHGSPAEWRTYFHNMAI